MAKKEQESDGYDGYDGFPRTPHTVPFPCL